MPVLVSLLTKEKRGIFQFRTPDVYPELVIRNFYVFVCYLFLN